MARLVRIGIALLVLATASGCGDPEPSPVPVDETGFPIDWPVAIPPGSVDGCDNGEVIQEDAVFSVVMCLPDQPDPFAASQQYLAQLETDGFTERDPGAFRAQGETFLDGNGIEIYFQLVENEATIVLIKPAA